MGVLAEEFVRIRPLTTGFQAEASRGVLGGVGRLAKQVSATLGAAVIGKALFLDPIKSAAEFQRTLNVLQAQSGATAAEMKSVSATAVRLGADITLPGTSASDAAGAMFELAKAGLSVRQSQQAVRGVLVASTAAQIDNAQAATIVANALNAFALPAREAVRVSDLLAAAANAASGDIPGMAQSLTQVATQAHALKIPIEDTVTAVAELANAGIQGARAGTSLKVMFQRLIPQSKAAKDEMAKLNVNLFDQQGHFIGLEKTAGQFHRALAPLTDEQRANAIQTIFGSDAQRAANIIFGQGSDVFAKLKDRVTEVGAAQKIATAQSKGLSGAWSALQSTIETLQLRLGLVLVPVLTRVALLFANDLPRAFDATSRFVGGVVERIQALSQSMNQTQGIVLGVVAALALFAGPVATVVALGAAAVYLYQSFQPVASVVDAVARALDGHLQIVVAITGGILAAVAAFRTMAVIVGSAQAALVALGIAAPVAAAGVAEVGAAAATAATEVGVATRAATAFNPLLLALSVGVGLVTAGFLSNTQQTGIMDAAYRSATDAVNGLSDAFRTANRASQDVTFAAHNLHAAQTQLTAAQQNYNRVLKDGNATQLERRQALDQVRAAQDNVKRSQNQLTDSEAKAREEHGKARVALQGVRNATVNLTDATGKQIRALGNLGSESNRNRAAAAALADKLRDYSAKASEAANKSGHLSDTFRRAKEDSARAAAAVALLATQLGRLPTHKEIRITETTIRQVSTIEDNRLNREAGGPVLAGVPYIVGEKRAELFIPNQSGVILPRVPSSLSGGGQTVNFNGPVTVVAGSPGGFIDWANRAARRSHK